MDRKRCSFAPTAEQTGQPIESVRFIVAVSCCRHRFAWNRPARFAGAPVYEIRVPRSLRANGVSMRCRPR